MRQLILLRGAMGSGKSTWVEDNGLKQYTLCADDIRLLYQSPILTPDGGENISMAQDSQVWKLLKQLLEDRMKRGEFSVIDATHSKTKDINQYRELAQKYRYRVTVVDFADIPMELAKEQNLMRPVYKRVPDEAIENVYSRFETQHIPNWCTVIKPYEFAEKVTYAPADYSHYKKIHHIGDIHGCHDVLMAYLREGIKDDELYIFVGDYIDRGIQNGEVMEFLFSIMDKKNVIFLEGNHEHWLWKWANGENIVSKEFNKYTKPELEAKGVSKKTTRMFYRKLQQIVYYTRTDADGTTVKVLVSHGGVGYIPENLLLVSTDQFIKGVGDYTTDIDKHFEENEIETLKIRGGVGNVVLLDTELRTSFQIHGHRNIFGHTTRASRNSFNLEGGIERGGQLRAVVLGDNGFESFDYDNTKFDERHVPKMVDADTTVEEMLDAMKSNRYIKENKMSDALSSFNFTQQAFYKGVWNSQTMRARGLFINKETQKIVARSYDKFFNVNEREETSIPMLKRNLEFPVMVREKPNGYLGILGYDEDTDELIFASKSSTKSEHAKWFKDLFYKSFDLSTIEAIGQFLRAKKDTLTFEVIDPVNDPHIIKYDKAKLILLDIVGNTPNFQKETQVNLESFARFIDVENAKLLHVFENWKEFYEWYEDVTTDYGIKEEGYIIEDSNGFMTKLKLPYYKMWKGMRSVKMLLAGGRPVNTGRFTTPLENRVYGFLQTKSREELKSKEIIELREEYEQTL